MKKLLAVFIAIWTILVLTSCPQPDDKIGTPILNNINFGLYDTFAVMRETNSNSKSLSDSLSSNLNRLFGYVDKTFEKIAIEDENGIEWACNKVKPLQSKYLALILSETRGANKSYLIDRDSNKIFDLSFFGQETSIINNLQVTANGIFTTHNDSVVKVDLDKKLITPLTNSEIDKARAFIRDDEGNMLVAISYSKLKLFIGNEAPKDCLNCPYNFAGEGLIAKKADYLITNSSANVFYHVRSNKIGHISSGELVWEDAPYEYSISYSYNYEEGKCIYPINNSEFAMKVISSIPDENWVTIHDLSSGELIYTKYILPDGFYATDYINGSVLMRKGEDYCLYNLENKESTFIVKGPLINSQMTPSGFIYTKYLNATDVQTYLYNFATDETELMNTSGVEVISIASFVQ